MYSLKGFCNIGNTCYLNAGLQLIINNRDLCNLIVNNNNSNNEILNKLSDFIKAYYNDNSKTLTPAFIKELMGNHNKEFVGFNQNDSFEFIIFFLEIIFKLFDELKLNNKIELQTIYEIQTNISIKCKIKRCLTVSTNIEKNNFLLLDILDNTNTLDDSYRNYKAREKLMDDNSYYCSNCKEKRTASKRCEIGVWPKHLIIVLKRFSHNGRSRKIDKELQVPLLWRHNYKLKGFVYHSGSPFGGHYIYIGCNNNKWIMYDDSHLNELYENQLTQYLNRGYIYYYEMT